MIDPGLPPGGLQSVFVQYDRIVSHHIPLNSTPQETKPPEEDEKPPWSKPPADVEIPQATDEQKEAQVKQDLGYDPKKSWRNINADREEEALNKMYKSFENPNGASLKQDQEGLDKAYADKTSKGVYYDPTTRTEYIKGSQTPRDWWDDFTKVPFWGDTKKSERYQEAEKAYDDLQGQGKPVDRVVGHSLGGSVALEMQKEKGIARSRTFGAPVVHLNMFGSKAERYRHPLDPVSIMDRGAKWGKFKGYPHTYTDFA